MGLFTQKDLFSFFMVRIGNTAVHRANSRALRLLMKSVALAVCTAVALPGAGFGQAAKLMETQLPETPAIVVTASAHHSRSRKDNSIDAIALKAGIVVMGDDLRL